MQEVTHGGRRFAIIIRHDYHADGVSFPTPQEALLQWGYMSHPAGKRIPPHKHTPFERVTQGTQEVLFVKRGRMRVDFYAEDDRYLESVELTTGDWIVLLGQGHGFEMLEPTVLIEVKNGPYAEDKDKVRFEPREGPA